MRQNFLLGTKKRKAKKRAAKEAASLERQRIADLSLWQRFKSIVKRTFSRKDKSA